MTTNKKIYFLSDFHLGAPNANSSLQREKAIVAFLDSIASSAAEIFILGDMFDFWFEYKTVVPKGFVRILGKLAQLSDAGITLHFFVGNHDMWMRNYLQQELGCKVYFDQQIFERNGIKIFIAHGDGLGPGDIKYKLLKKVFRSRLCQWLFGWLHPDMGIGLANYFSRKSRAKTGASDAVFLGEDKEWLIQYCEQKIKTVNAQYFVFGHRHLPIEHKLSNSAMYINTGDWIKYFTYAELEHDKMVLKKWEK